MTMPPRSRFFAVRARLREATAAVVAECRLGWVNLRRWGLSLLRLPRQLRRAGPQAGVPQPAAPADEERPRFYALRVRLRKATAAILSEGWLGFRLAQRTWVWVVKGPGRVMAHPVLRRLVLGLPAAAVATAAVTVLAVNPRGAQDKFRTRYRQEAEQAFAYREWDAARIRYRRLAADTGYSADDVFGRADAPRTKPPARGGIHRQGRGSGGPLGLGGGRPLRPTGQGPPGGCRGPV